MWRKGLVAPRHVGSSPSRARTRVPCIGKWILNHCTTREAPGPLFLYVLVLSFVCIGYSVYCCSQGYRGSEWVWEGHQEEGEGNDSFHLSSPKNRLATLKLRFPKVVRHKVQKQGHGDYITFLYSHSETDLGHTISSWDPKAPVISSPARYFF